jgi:hypothetical protein
MDVDVSSSEGEIEDSSRSAGNCKKDTTEAWGQERSIPWRWTAEKRAYEQAIKYCECRKETSHKEERRGQYAQQPADDQHTN